MSSEPIFKSIFGEGNAEEIAVDEDVFEMFVTISHPWWGKMYEYKGQFELRKNA
ncbi:MAG: DUF4166 domain-containing protein [Xanthomonadales bacterium]|nr:DUF4166 domain-containing protein [Xanthomonadales bacterium]